MVEIDVDGDKVTRVVALSEKVSEDRGGMGHFIALPDIVGRAAPGVTVPG